jgi:hypothetical protein
VIKKKVLNKNIGKVMAILVLRYKKLGQKGTACTTEILIRCQLVTEVVSRDPWQIET